MFITDPILMRFSASQVLENAKKRNPHFILILSSFWNLIKFASNFALDFCLHFILILKAH